MRQLTSDGASEAIDWSPDGELVLFLRAALDAKDPEKQVWELWVMDADGGSAETRLPFNRSTLEVVAADWGTS